jgi:hypothetical protein
VERSTTGPATISETFKKIAFFTGVVEDLESEEDDVVHSVCHIRF